MYFFLVMALPDVTEKGQQRSARLVATLGTPGATRFNPRIYSVKSGPWGHMLRWWFKPWLGPLSAVDTLESPVHFS